MLKYLFTFYHCIVVWFIELFSSLFPEVVSCHFTDMSPVQLFCLLYSMLLPKLLQYLNFVLANILKTKIVTVMLK